MAPNPAPGGNSEPVNPYITKDTGQRTAFASGMEREVKAGLPRFELLIPGGIPYSDQVLTRTAALVARGAEKYKDRGWEMAATPEELEHFRQSAFRHFIQFMCQETDEDHAAAAIFNIMAAETVQYKIRTAQSSEEKD